MAKLRDIAQKVRSKNAGPFWLTIDIFCADETSYQKVAHRLQTDAVAKAFDVPSQTLKRFDMPELNVVKISLPRPAIQGSVEDRDLHGASWAALVADLTI